MILPNNKMEPLKIAFTYAILTYLLFMLFSCKTIQLVHDKTNTDTSKIVSKDSIITIINNNAITDSLTVVISELKTGNKVCDSLCKIQVDQLLQQINSSKHSGTNSAVIYYDKKTNSIKAVATIGATSNKQEKTKTLIQNSSTATKVIEVPIEKNFTTEQKFNLWSGRVFWVLVFVYAIRKISLTAKV